MNTFSRRTLAAFVIAASSFSAQAAMEDDPLLYYFKADQLELRDGDEGNVIVFDGQFWAGKDLNKLWIKSEIEADEDETESSEWQFLYSRAIDSNWDLQAGFRTDIKPEPERNWLALGLYGVAPYWFEIDTAIFIEEDEQINLRIEAEYEFLFTQKWILTPEIEVNWYSEEDEDLGIGSGLAEMETGIRLRYEFSREFASYIGVNYETLLGDTRDLARDSNAETSDTQLLAGLRFWF